MIQTPDISIVIPAKNEEESITELSQSIMEVMGESALSYEVIFIDDGSEDNTWQKIAGINEKTPTFKGIRFNRNYGKAAALQMGFQHAIGRVIITLDADLQDDPGEIPALYKMISEESYHLVSGWKKIRHDPISKTLPSRLFNYVTRKMSGVPLHDFNSGIKAYQHVVAKSIDVYGEMHRYIPILVKWRGFNRIGEKIVTHAPRKYGKTKFGRERFMRGFLDLLSIMFMGKFQRKPMHFFGSLGIFSLFLGVVLTTKLLYEKLYSLFVLNTMIKRDITDQPIFYIALSAIIIGVQLFLTGYLAEMIALQSMAKRHYLIIDQIGIKNAVK